MVVCVYSIWLLGWRGVKTVLTPPNLFDFCTLDDFCYKTLFSFGFYHRGLLFIVFFFFLSSTFAPSPPRGVGEFGCGKQKQSAIRAHNKRNKHQKPVSWKGSSQTRPLLPWGGVKTAQGNPFLTARWSSGWHICHRVLRISYLNSCPAVWSFFPAWGKNMQQSATNDLFPEMSITFEKNDKTNFFRALLE